MAFTGVEDHSFPLSTSSQWTKNYRTANPGDTQGHYFSKKAISDILAQEECVGIRVYYALDDDSAKQLIVTGVTANEDDLYNGKLAERSIKCPPTCGSLNPLNS